MIKKYYLKIKDLFFSKTARHSGIVFVGNIIAAGVGFFSTIIVSRTLGPYNFGIVALLFSIMSIISGITDFGIGAGVVRFASLYIKKDTKKADTLLNIAFKIELAIGLLIIVTGIIFSKYIAYFLGGDYLIFPVRLAFLGGLGLSMSAYMGAILQSHQKFIKFSLINLVPSIIKIAVIALCVLFGVLTLNNSLFIYALIPMVGFLFGFVLIPKKFLFRKNIYSDKSQKKEIFETLFHFSKWIMISFIINTFMTRLDVIFLSRLKGAYDVGIYSVAFQLFSGLLILLSAMTSVLLPKVSQIEIKKGYISYIKKIVFSVSIISLALLPILFFSKPIITLFFGQQYLGSIAVFNVLFINFIILLFINPISLIIYSLNKSKVLTLINFVQFFAGIFIYYLLIKYYGPVGAALSYLSITIIGGILITGYLYKRLRHQRARADGL